ncbi:hypothetical protein KSF78_0002661 [Schistosoma japonicum]|nr:hypothetical protein KSF78_0002661 [Schistosoma japonicum]
MILGDVVVITFPLIKMVELMKKQRKRKSSSRELFKTRHCILLCNTTKLLVPPFTGFVELIALLSKFLYYLACLLLCMF